MLCNDAHVVTCAHVVDPGESKPTEAVFVEFKFANRHDPIPAVVIDDGWHPARGDGSGDIAVLKLQGLLPSGVRNAPMSDTKGIKSHPFRAYGYPRGHELDGVWSEGSIVGHAKSEWL
jgi:cellulose synthase operon protein C